MRVYYTSRSRGIRAEAEYNNKDNTLTLLKGSIVSDTICHSNSFNSTGIERLRSEYVLNRITQEDIEFKSPSSAANFVTGCSSNGKRVWKTQSGISLKTALLDS